MVQQYQGMQAHAELSLRTSYLPGRMMLWYKLDAIVCIRFHQGLDSQADALCARRMAPTCTPTAKTDK